MPGCATLYFRPTFASSSPSASLQVSGIQRIDHQRSLDGAIHRKQQQGGCTRWPPPPISHQFPFPSLRSISDLLVGRPRGKSFLPFLQSPSPFVEHIGHPTGLDSDLARGDLDGVGYVAQVRATEGDCGKTPMLKGRSGQCGRCGQRERCGQQGRRQRLQRRPQKRLVILVSGNTESHMLICIIERGQSVRPHSTQSTWSVQ